VTPASRVLAARRKTRGSELDEVRDPEAEDHLYVILLGEAHEGREASANSDRTCG
jgi:hypothetical protein